MGIIVCKVMMDGCWMMIGLDPVGPFPGPPLTLDGFSSAIMKGNSSALMAPTRGLTTLPTSETRFSRIVFSPSPLTSASIPRLTSSKVSKSSPARPASANAWSWVGFGLGACGVGVARNAEDDRRGRRFADRLESNTDKGRCRQRSIARCK